jgi:Tfp pilus assembly protein PilF
MRRVTVSIIAFVLLVTAGSAFAQVRGKGRLQGIVTDAATAKPVDGAKVTISPADGGTQPIVVKTNAKGRWSALGLTSGQWNVDIEAKGFAASRGSVNVSELQMMPPVATTLQAEAPVEEAPAAVQTSGVPQEVVAAVTLGQELMAAEKYKEAVVEFEKALPALPDNMGLKQVTAQAYYKAGELKKAIGLLEVVTAAPEAPPGVVLLLTNLYLENGQLDEAKARLATLPAEAVTDPTVYVNIGILFLNKNNPAEAATYFSKAVGMDQTRPESFYYRGLANVQLKNTQEAKADFEKVLQLAPDSPEGRDAKQLIDSLK